MLNKQEFFEHKRQELMKAVRCGDAALVRGTAIDLDIMDWRRVSRGLLHTAVMLRQPEMVDLLIDLGVDREEKYEGQTAVVASVHRCVSESCGANFQRVSHVKILYPNIVEMIPLVSSAKSWFVTQALLSFLKSWYILQ